MKTKILALAFTAACLISCSSTPGKPTLNQKKAAIYFESGNDSLFAGRPTDALVAYLEALKYDPKNVDVLNNLGLAYGAKGEDELAIETWKKALSLDPSLSDTRNNLGAMYIKLEKLNEAEKELKEVLKDITYDKIFQVHYNLGLIYRDQRKLLLSEQHFKLAIQSNSTHCPSWFELGHIQKEREEIQLAIDSLKKSVAGTCFDNPRALYEIGELQIKKRDVIVGKNSLLDVIQFFPNSEWAKKAEITLNMLH